VTYIGAAEHADNAAEKARMARQHVAEGDYAQRYLAEAVEGIAEAIAELARNPQGG